MARLSKDGISSIFGLPLELCPAVSHHSHYENNNCHLRGETFEWNSEGDCRGIRTTHNLRLFSWPQVIA